MTKATTDDHPHAGLRHRERRSTPARPAAGLATDGGPTGSRNLRTTGRSSPDHSRPAASVAPPSDRCAGGSGDARRCLRPPGAGRARSDPARRSRYRNSRRRNRAIPGATRRPPSASAHPREDEPATEKRATGDGAEVHPQAGALRAAVAPVGSDRDAGRRPAGRSHRRGRRLPAGRPAAGHRCRPRVQRGHRTTRSRGGTRLRAGHRLPGGPHRGVAGGADR